MESGPRPAAAQLENRQRRFGLRLLSLSQSGQAREAADAASSIGQRLECTLSSSGRTESTVLLEEPETLGADLIQEEETEAKVEAERFRPGSPKLQIGHDPAMVPLDMRLSGSMVNAGQVGLKTHMGYNQEAYDAECAALARALGTAAKRQMAPERVAIFIDAQAARSACPQRILAPAR